MKRLFAICTLIPVLGFEGSAMAQEATPSNLKISGFVNTMYETGVNRDASTFSMDQAELNVSKESQTAGFLLDLNYIRGQSGSADEVVEQGLVWLGTADKRFKFAMGKFNAPIGFESVDPVDMYQISHAMVYTYGLPTNLTGLKFSAGVGILDIVAYWVNGWDLLEDNNKAKTIGARAGLKISKAFILGFSFITGNEGPDTVINGDVTESVKTNNITVVDLDFTITAGAATTIGGEVNYGMFANQSITKPGSDASWMAFMVLVNHKITPNFAMTGRYDYFNDPDGARLGSGLKENRNAFTLCADYLAAERLRILGEFKFTISNEKVYTNSSGKDSSTDISLAAEALYSF